MSTEQEAQRNALSIRFAPLPRLVLMGWWKRQDWVLAIFSLEGEEKNNSKHSPGGREREGGVNWHWHWHWHWH